MAREKVKTNLEATVPPTADDDDVAGYDLFSPWLVTTDGGSLYFCVDPSTGAAKWKRVDNLSLAVQSLTLPPGAKTFAPTANTILLTGS